MKTLPPLVAITPGDHGRGRDLLEWLGPLGEAGLPAVLLREPHLEPHDYWELAHETRAKVPLVLLHHRAAGAKELAMVWGLGLHVPSDSDLSVLRTDIPGPVGVSCHTEAQVHAALEGGADYAFLSPIWSPVSKPDDDRAPLGLDRYLEVAAGRQVLALGGVTPERFEALRQSGGVGAAVCGSIFGAPGVDEAVVQLRGLLAAAGD